MAKNQHFSDLDHQHLVWWASCPDIGMATLSKLDLWRKRVAVPWRKVLSKVSQLRSEKVIQPAQYQALLEFQKTWQPNTLHSYLWKRQIWTLTLYHSAYPACLASIDSAPWVLFGKSSSDVVRAHQTKKGPGWKFSQTFQDYFNHAIAVVGTRHPSHYGTTITEQLVSASKGYASSIVSGFMYGIDVAAHQTAIQHQIPTIAVLGFGFDNYYPKHHALKAKKWLENQEQAIVFLSEHPPWVSAKPGLFRQRNRIVAGLSQDIIIPEAGLQSGTLITAQFAAEYSRDVWAVPGSLLSPVSLGTAKLIANGAKIVTDVHEPFHNQNVTNSAKSSEKVLPSDFDGDTNQVKAILQQLQAGQLTTNELQRTTNIPLAEIMVLLTELELQKMVSQHGAYWSLDLPSLP